MDKQNKKTLLGYLTIVSITIIILFTSFTSQFFVIYPFLSPLNIRSILILAFLNISILMMIINYFLTCTTDPGRVPDNWMPRQQAYIEVKKSTHAPRFCRTCKNFKPPRSHHCSRCQRCNLKMDHHCPWVDNCIGFANYGHFIRLILYIVISSAYILTLLSCRAAQLINSSHSESTQLNIAEVVFLAINMVITAAAFLALGILSCYHLFYIATNTTTIEAWEKGKSLTIKGMGTVKNVKYPYNQGIYKNFAAVLGPWPFFWLWPQTTTTGNGLDFSVNNTRFQGSDQSDSYKENSHSVNDFIVNKQFATSSTTCLNRDSSNLSSYDSNHDGSLTSAFDKTHFTATEDLNTASGPIFEEYYLTVPESILTFSTNATTLVGEQHDVSSRPQQA